MDTWADTSFERAWPPNKSQHHEMERQTDTHRPEHRVLSTSRRSYQHDVIQIQCAPVISRHNLSRRSWVPHMKRKRATACARVPLPRPCEGPLYIYVHVYVCMYVCVCVCVCVRMPVCIYVCVCMYMNTHAYYARRTSVIRVCTCSFWAPCVWKQLCTEAYENFLPCVSSWGYAWLLCEHGFINASIHMLQRRSIINWDILWIASQMLSWPSVTVNANFSCIHMYVNTRNFLSCKETVSSLREHLRNAMWSIKD